ncbi:MAG TPA: hypothetical protein VH092_27855 [Urbifossiella sp.]|jgi:hypothetical protein|nr:hypothetical protein [Urbifossiella sp.]
MARLIPTFAFAAVLVVSAGSAGQEEKKDTKGTGPTGVWTREAGGLDLKFDFGGKGSFKLVAFAGVNGIVATCKYAVKDGVVKAEVTDVDEKGSFPSKPPVGFEFSFKWVAKGDTAELSDLKGDNIDNVKPVVEGEYQRAKEKGKKD